MANIYFSQRSVIWSGLSNFTNCEFVDDDITYYNVESMFQAYKIPEERKQERKQFERIRPGYAKRLGRSVDLRKDWEHIKYKVMLKALRLRFESDKSFRELLRQTGNSFLVEDTTSWHDNIWGACFCPRCREGWAGNKLGVAMMTIRSENFPELKTIKFNYLGKEFETDDLVIFVDDNGNTTKYNSIACRNAPNLPT